MANQTNYDLKPLGNAKRLLQSLRVIDDTYNPRHQAGQQYSYAWGQNLDAAVRHHTDALALFDGHCSLEHILYSVIKQAITATFGDGFWRDFCVVHHISAPQSSSSTRPAFFVQAWKAFFYQAKAEEGHVLMQFAQSVLNDIEPNSTTGMSTSSVVNDKQTSLARSLQAVKAPLINQDLVAAVEGSFGLTVKNNLGLRVVLDQLPAWTVPIPNACQVHHLGDPLCRELLLDGIQVEPTCSPPDRPPQKLLRLVLPPAAIHDTKTGDAKKDDILRDTWLLRMWRAYAKLMRWAAQMAGSREPCDLIGFLRSQEDKELMHEAGGVREVLGHVEGVLKNYRGQSFFPQDRHG